MLGNAIHGALEKFFGLRSEDRQPPDAVLHRCLRSVWKTHRRADTFATVDEERDYGEQGLRMLSLFTERFDTAAVPMARERWVSTRPANGVELFGRADRIDGSVHEGQSGVIDVIDYKPWRPRSGSRSASPSAHRRTCSGSASTAARRWPSASSRRPARDLEAGEVVEQGGVARVLGEAFRGDRRGARSQSPAAA